MLSKTSSLWKALILFGLLLLLATPVLASSHAQNGTTLAAYKTLDICVTSTGQWRYSGVISVWNSGAIDTENFTIYDFIEYKVGRNWSFGFVVPVSYSGQIPAGTTQETALTFPYSYDGPALPGTIRNSVQLTITNHSGQLGQPFGPNPKATYTGSNPPPPCDNGNGCTLTQGYWKNHPESWPAGFSPDAAFFLSGKTWMQVFNTPVQGNNYYNLAHQYMAAILNQANGASVPVSIQTTLNLSTAWFNVTLPTACGPGGCGTQNAWAGALDEYNNGLYPGGPPHCGSLPFSRR